MLGLREKGARHSDRWLWRKWETFDFTPDREYWQDHSMPSIPALLERHGRGNRIEDLVLSLQISSRALSPSTCRDAKL